MTVGGPPDPRRWQRLSPLLDELLDLDDDAARAARLAVLRAQDAALADDLEALLHHDSDSGRAGFLSAPVLPPPADAPAHAGMVLGPYTLERELGRGGMGSVWLARRSDGRFQGEVAIKFLHGGLLAAQAGRRFAREGQILARLAHPHIARLLDAGVADGGSPYLVLDYVAGESIDQWCQAHGLGLTERVRLLLDVLDAVAHAHSRLILHRDLKPGNILVTADGQVKLLDFGIAKLMADHGATVPASIDLTQRAGSAYTPAYAAPEQVQGQEVTTATDVYTLGVLMFGLLGGGHPTSADGTPPLDRLRDVVDTPPRRLSDAVRQQGGAEARQHARALRGDLDTIVAKALKKAPAERYANAAALADDLRRWLAHEPIAARPDSRAYRLLRLVQRNRLAVAAGTLVLASLTVGLGAALWQAQQAQAQREQAEGLVEFMLGELYRKLEPVGRLDALDVVARRALAHYDAAPALAREPAAQRRRARALRVLGRTTALAGRLDEGIALARQSLALADAATVAAPDDVPWLAEQSATLRELHHLLRERGDQAGMAAVMPRHVAVARRLARLAPDDAERQRDLAVALETQGVQQLDAEQLDAAQATFEAAVAGLAPHTERHPPLRSTLGDLYGWLSRTQELQGRRGEAVATMRRKLALWQADTPADGAAGPAALPGSAPGAAAEADGNRRQNIAHAQGEIGRIAMQDNDLDTARSAFDTALGLARGLVARDPANLEWRQQQWALNANQAWLALAQHRLADSAAHLGNARDDLAVMLRGEPDNPFWQLYAQGKLLQAGCALAAAGGAPVAPAALRALTDAADAQVARGRRLEPQEQRAVATTRLCRGDQLAQAGQHDAAQAQWTQALAALQSPQNQRQPEALATQARLQRRLGDAAAALASAASAAAGPPGGPEWTAWRRELAAAEPAGPVPTVASRRH